MDQLAALRALRRVVELGGFTAAAEALGVSHSAVSRQIRQLETRLGAAPSSFAAELYRERGWD